MSPGERERAERALKWSSVSVAIAFSVSGFFGTVIGIADPDGGWAAWRVGLLTATIAAAVVFVISLVMSVAYILEG